jgi:hypothetical protein
VLRLAWPCFGCCEVWTLAIRLIQYGLVPLDRSQLRSASIPVHCRCSKSPRTFSYNSLRLGQSKFTALQSFPSNDRNSSETLSMSSNKQHDGSRTWPQKNVHSTTTWRQRFATSPFQWKPLLMIFLLPFAMSPIVILARLAEQTSQNYLRNRDCYPNGLWKEQLGATWRIMDSSYFFKPNLSFGSMTFTQVKVIDIAWDLLVGRGGQLLLAWVNYRVFNEWLYFHMELHKTSYKMYTTIAFSTTSLAALGVLGKEFLAFGKGTWRRFFRWLGILSMLISTVYVISFRDPEDNLIRWNKVNNNENNVVGFITDAQRIGWSSPLVCLRNDTTLLAAIMDCKLLFCF